MNQISNGWEPDLNAMEDDDAYAFEFRRLVQAARPRAMKIAAHEEWP